MEQSGKLKNAGHPRLLRWGDLLVMAAVLALAAVSFYILYVRAEPGAVAVVTTPEGSFTLPLDTDTRRVLTGREEMKVVLLVSDGRVCFEESGCPDQICVHTGWLSKNGQSAACLPAGIAIRVEVAGEGPDILL